MRYSNELPGSAQGDERTGRLVSVARDLNGCPLCAV
jgi:hypothetical protein